MHNPVPSALLARSAGAAIESWCFAPRGVGLTANWIPTQFPLTKTADFTVAAGETWFINNKAGSTCTVTLPAASANPGRTLNFKNAQAQSLVSAASNVVPLESGSPAVGILSPVVGNWASVVSDGTNWVIMQSAPNNILLLE